MVAILATGGVGAAANAASPATAADGNFVVNGTFDNGTNGWHGTKTTKLNTGSGKSGQGAVLGNKSSKPTTVSLNDWNDSVAATVAGHTYRATADIKVQKPEQGAAIVLREWDHSADKAKQVSHVQNHDWVTSDRWQSISVDYTAKTDGATLDLNLVAYKLAKGNTVTVDNITLYDVTAGEPAAQEPGPVVEPRPLPEVTPPPVVEPAPPVAEPADPTAGPTTEPAPLTKPGNWKLAFSDEFNGTDVNRDNWKVLNNSTYGDGNNELACLMDRPENVSVGDGVLKISAQLEKTPLQCGTRDTRFPDGRSYSSGFLDSKNKVAFEYGRFEARVKTPNAHGETKGLWPAFWLRPEVGGLGEIDIFEIIGTSPGDEDTSNRTTQSIHYDYVKTYPHQNKAYHLPEGNFADGFHTHAVEWAPGSLKFYVDDVLAYERDTTTTPWLDKAFSGAFHMKLNMAVGGNWTGSPDKYTSFPADFEVDYVRVYQR